MPYRALRPCAYPGCPNLVKHGRCSQHKLQRDLAIHRLYSTHWKQRRTIQLAREPWCADHLAKGEYVEATDVHHIQPHHGDEYKFFTGELQSLCKPCHSRHTLEEQRQ